MRIAPIDIAPAASLQELQERLVTSINQVIDQLNIKPPPHLDGKNYRVINVDDPINPKDAVNLKYLNERLERLPAMARSAGVTTRSSGSGGVSTTRLTIVEYTLTSNLTIPSPFFATTNDILVVYVTQGAGPYTIAFDTDFDQSVNTNIPGEAGTTTVFMFVGRSDGKWWATASPSILPVP